jgi:hypothetical protein
MSGEIEEIGEVLSCATRVPRVGQSGIGISEFIEERVAHRLDSGETLRRRVFQQSRDQINGLVRSSPEYLRDIELVYIRKKFPQSVFTLLNGCGLI